MILKLMGTVFVVAGCGGIGFWIAVNYRREEANLWQLIGILDYMECELQYRMTPMTALCQQISKVFSGAVGNIFSELGNEMEAQVFPDLAACMSAVVANSRKLTRLTQEELLLLGRSAGRFDLEGQLKGIDAVRQDCKRQMESLSNNRDSRLRSYQTLGLCAGAALAILFI